MRIPIKPTNYYLNQPRIIPYQRRHDIPPGSHRTRDAYQRTRKKVQLTLPRILIKPEWKSKTCCKTHTDPVIRIEAAAAAGTKASSREIVNNRRFISCAGSMSESWERYKKRMSSARWRRQVRFRPG